MNEDHYDTIVDALNAQHGVNHKTAQMVQLNIDGYYLRTKRKLYFIKFSKTCHSPKEYKDELVDLAKRYRQT